MYSALIKIFTQRSGWLIACLTAGFLYVIASIVSTYEFIASTFTNPSFVRLSLISLLEYVLTYLPHTMSKPSFVLVLMIAILAGSLSAGLVHIIRMKGSMSGVSGIGGAGLIAGLFGIGCGACGSVFMTSIVGFGASTFILAILPLHGIEFLLMGILLLSVSNFLILHYIASSGTCRA